MSFIDPIGDMLTRIRNGQMRNLSQVKIPASNFRGKILDVLVKEGYIKDYKPLKDENNKPNFKVDLKYNLGNPVISTIVRISRPGRRIYSRAESIPKINNGLGISIVSTSKGIMTDSDARRQNVGGEVICKVFWCLK